MMERNAMTEKLFVMGIDGFEPRLAKKFMDEGKMPNLKKFKEAGACREDLVLLGAMPTVTPPQWTTLATGAYPNTHGITCFFAQDPENLDTMLFNLDSRRCQAEPLWNVFVEAGKETLVWHWPGSSWPPTSDSPKLSVVDGVQPVAVNAGLAACDLVKIIGASEKYTDTVYLPNSAELAVGTGCIINDLEDVVDLSDMEENGFRKALREGASSKGLKNIMISDEECEVNTLAKLVADSVKSAIKPAKGWADAPSDAKEFMVYVSNGLVRKYVLLTKNAQGIFDTVSVYHSKKDGKPFVSITGSGTEFAVSDVVRDAEGLEIPVVRNYAVLDIAEDGGYVNMIIDMAMDVTKDDLFHPKSLYQEVINNVGYIPTRSGLNGTNTRLVEEIVIPYWDHYTMWQADVLTYFMENNRFEVIFSHLHNVDSMGHYYWHYAKHQEEWGNDELKYQGFIEQVYKDTDKYIGRFLPYLDQGWTMIITSDHGLIISEHHGNCLGEMGGVNVPVMQALGYTYLRKDDNGQDMREIDWSKTQAIAIRGDHIYLNIKGRDKYGIVEPEDQYELESQIISDLYNYRDEKTGKRIVSLALRNKDAALLGMSGPECGDIIYFKEEGFNVIHADSLSTACGYANSSVSPIFLAAGPGIKQNFATERVIRQVDIAPTMAVLGGVRMPAQCEGAPVYQILEKQY